MMVNKSIHRRLAIAHHGLAGGLDKSGVTGPERAPRIV
jgi:hypothetical protein